MKKYKSFLKKQQYRHIVQRIAVLFRQLLDNFVEEDQSKIINIFYYIYKVGDYLSILFEVCFYMLIFLRIKPANLALLASFIYLLASCYFGEQPEKNEIRSEMAFLLKYAQNQVLINKIIFMHWKKFYVRKFIMAIIFINLAQCIFGKFNLIFSFISCIILLIIAIITIAVFFIRVYKVPFKKVFKKDSYNVKQIIVREEEATDQYVSEDIFMTLLMRQLRYNQTQSFVRLCEIGLIAIFVLGVILYTVTKVDKVYLIVIVFNFFPSIVNTLMLNIITRNFLHNDFISMNYYLMKKYNIKHNLIKYSQKILLRLSKSFMAIYGLLILLITGIEMTNVLLIVCSTLQYYCISKIISVKTYIYSKYDYDDIKVELYANVIQNPIEELLIIGLPIILTALIIYYVYRYSILVYVWTMIGYTFIMYLYAVLITLRVNRKTSR